MLRGSLLKWPLRIGAFTRWSIRRKKKNAFCIWQSLVWIKYYSFYVPFNTNFLHKAMSVVYVFFRICDVNISESDLLTYIYSGTIRNLWPNYLLYSFWFCENVQMLYVYVYAVLPSSHNSIQGCTMFIGKCPE